LGHLNRLAAAALLFAAVSLAAPKNILILHSYRVGYDWTDELSRGLRTGFEDAGDYTLWFEFLDARRNAYPANVDQIRQRLALDHASRKFDLIIAADDEALDFVASRAPTLFPAPPVVFCGVSELPAPLPLPRSRFTGLIETTDAAKLIQLANQLRPQARHLYFVADNSQFGASMSKLFAAATAQTPGLTFHLLDGHQLTIDDITQAVTNLPADSIFFLTPFRHDATRYVGPAAGEQVLARASPVPVFGAYVSRPGNGFLLGTSNIGFEHGLQTAQLALQVLAGTPPAALPIRPAGGFHLLFDHAELQRWNINENQLPPGAEVVNRPPSIWLEYRPWILAGAAFALLQLLVISALIVNIVRRRKVQADLEVALQKTREADALKSRFIANTSHELRTPMNGVLGLLQVLQSTTLDPHQQEYVALATTSARSLLTLLNDILDLSQIEAGHLRLAPAPFSLPQALQHIANLLGPAATAGVTLRHEIHPDVPPVLIGDADRLSQVLINLTANALKFTPQGAVHLEVHQLTRTPHRATLRFEVHDTGIGIPPAQIQRIFDPFVQADAGAARKFGGAGLGLAISRELVRAMGGEIGGRSTPGQGSTFWFQIALPYQLDPLPASPAPSPPIPRFHNRVVLLVEDNPVNRLVARKLLDRTGCHILLAEDGEQCLAQLPHPPQTPTQPIDLILMDVQMPGLSGIDVTRLIRAMDGPIRHVPIVALTASSMSTDRDECLAAGMNAYLSKPISAENLLHTLEQWMPPPN
jgi:signal transduction histidine kinase/CheY-like chemotaxis protein